MIDFVGPERDDGRMGQSDGDENQVRGRDRRGSVWVREDYAVLVDGLRQGLADEDLAEQLGRTASGVRSRARFLLPADMARSGRPLEMLRAALAEAVDYPWEQYAREAHRANGQPFWGETEDDMLRLAWEDKTPLPDIAARLIVDEVQVVRRLIALGIATDTLAVTDRLGCSPDGYVDIRRRLAADRAATRVWVLVIHGLAGAESLHLSLHPTRDAAVTARDTFMAANVDELQASGPWWCIAERAPASDGGYTEVSD